MRHNVRAQNFLRHSVEQWTHQDYWCRIHKKMRSL